MEREIKIDILKEEDLWERYDKTKISKSLIDYLVEKSFYFDLNDKIKIVINHQLKINNCVDLVKKGLEDAYLESMKKSNRNNLVEIIYFILGILAIFFSNLMMDNIFKEVFLIGGWVLIWEMIELEVFSDIRDRRKRKVLKKLLNSSMNEIKE